MLMIYLWLMACAVMDARERRVPNALTFPLMGLALVQLAVYQTTLSGAPAQQAAVALLIALALSLPGFVLGRLGGGDVKLLVALGLASSPGVVLGSFVYGTVVLLLWAMVQRLRARPSMPEGAHASDRTLDRTSAPAAAAREMALAPSLCVGALLTAVWPLLS